MKKAVFSNFSVSIMIAAFGLIGSVLMARALGPGARGEVAAAILWPNLLIYLGSIGTYQAFIFYFSKDRDIKLMWGTCLAATFINSLLSMFAGFLMIRFALQGFSSDVKTYSYLLLVSIPFSMLSQYVVSIIQAKQQFKALNVFRSIFPILYLLSLVVLFLTKNLSFSSVVLAQFLLNVFQGIIAVAYYSFRFGNIASFKIKRRALASVYSYGSKVWIGDLSQGVNTRLDQIIIANLFSSVQLGYYVVAYSVASFTGLLASSSRTILLPVIASGRGQSDFTKKLKSSLTSFNKLNALMVVAFMVAGPFLLIMAYGEEFNESIKYLIVLLIGFAFINMKTVYATVLQGGGFPFQSSLSEIAGFLFLVLFAYPVSIWFGIQGMVVMISFSYFIQFLVVMYFFRNQKFKLA
jgi:O-antigen/teichoic acid export membrane protein